MTLLVGLASLGALHNFGKADPQAPKIILHVTGERPGTMHRNSSVHLPGPKAGVWAAKKVDHDIATVISGISDKS